jgi:hypothetical protein
MAFTGPRGQGRNGNLGTAKFYTGTSAANPVYASLTFTLKRI